MGDSQDPLDRLQSLHATCGCCERTLRRAKNDCQLVFPGGEAVSIDIDECQYFNQQATRPDLVALHRPLSGETLRWYVVEIKDRAKDVSGIIDQLRAGLVAISTFQSLDVGIILDEATALVLHTKGGRSEDWARLRERAGGLRLRGRSVGYLSRRCGVTLPVP